MRKKKKRPSNQSIKKYLKIFKVDEEFRDVYYNGIKTHYKVSNYGTVTSENYMNTGMSVPHMIFIKYVNY